MNSEQVVAKWQDYLFLTNEMKKFLGKRDLALFHSLLAQRGKIQEQIQAFSASEYYASNEGKSFLREIQQANQAMMQQFYLVFNTAKTGRAVSQAYEGGSSYAGRFINQQT